MKKNGILFARGFDANFPATKKVGVKIETINVNGTDVLKITCPQCENEFGVSVADIKRVLATLEVNRDMVCVPSGGKQKRPKLNTKLK